MRSRHGDFDKRIRILLGLFDRFLGVVRVPAVRTRDSLELSTGIPPIYTLRSVGKRVGSCTLDLDRLFVEITHNEEY